MADYSELLERLGAGLPYRAVPTTAAERQADPAVIKNKVDEDALRSEFAESAAAIRALIAEREEIISANRIWIAKCYSMWAERDDATLAEREACARVCDAEVARQAPLTRGGGTRWRDAVVAEAAALRLASDIRARSNG